MNPRTLHRLVLPARVRRFLRARHRAFVWRRAMRAFLRDPEAAAAPGSRLIRDLIYGWGNEVYSALEDYLTACAQGAASARGPILECGSGLTTIVVGVIAQRAGNTVWSLEHMAAYGDRVAKQLTKHRIDCVRLHTAPLKEHADFAWYDAPLSAMPDSFSLVLCDGPPGSTRGGRYGLAPVMKPRLRRGCVILLDDADRGDERSIARRWAAEFGGTHETVGVKRSILRMIVGEGAQDRPEAA
jgi:hypothetical protein